MTKRISKWNVQISWIGDDILVLESERKGLHDLCKKKDSACNGEAMQLHQQLRELDLDRKRIYRHETKYVFFYFIYSRSAKLFIESKLTTLNQL
jgi:hypothetical protein